MASIIVVGASDPRGLLVESILRLAGHHVVFVDNPYEIIPDPSARSPDLLLVLGSGLDRGWLPVAVVLSDDPGLRHVPRLSLPSGRSVEDVLEAVDSALEGASMLPRMSADLDRMSAAIGQAVSLDAMLSRLVDAALRLIPHATHAGVTLARDRGLAETAAQSGDLVLTIDQLQYRNGEGPCLSALWEQHPFRVEDASTERRWPLFAPQAAANGVRSILSLNLAIVGQPFGSLNIYAPDPGMFDADDERRGVLVAAHAVDAFTVQGSAGGIDAGAAIDQATRLIGSRQGLDPHQAFWALVDAARQHGRTLIEATEVLVGPT